MPTIKDVANLAGVSVGTVSRVIAKNATVKQPIKEKVEAAITELQFTPNFAARALRTNRIDVIGLVIPDITNPFFSQLAKSVETEATLRGYSVILASTNDDTKLEKKQVMALSNRGLSGIIIVAANGSSDLILNTEFPMVSVDRRFLDCPLIATDHRSGAAAIADHLFDLGHRRMGYIAGPRNTEVAQQRLEGFTSRINQLSQKTGPVDLIVKEAEFDFLTGEKIGHEILSVGKDLRPTAIACSSDQLAIGVLRAARDLGISVPQELSVAGFDDIDLASLVTPRLTTIKQPIELIAKRAIEYLFSEVEIGSEYLFPAELVVRNSTSAVNTRH